MAATNVQAFSGDVEVADSITKKHNTTYNTGSAGWYNLGTWDASAAGADTGARLLLTLIGGSGFDQGTSGNHGGETKIAATILNDEGGTTYANIRGSFWHIGGKPIASNVVFVQANADRLQYHVYAYILIYTTHAMDVDTTLNTTFTKTFTSVGDPGANGVTVQAATLSFVSTDGNVGIGTTDPGYILDVKDAAQSADKTMTRLYSQAQSTGTSYTGLRIEKAVGYGGIIKGFIEQGVGGGLCLNTLDGDVDVQRLTLRHTGNVGINTASPASGLHVRNPGGADVASSIIIQPASTQYARGYAKIEAYGDATVGAGTGLKFYTREDSGGNFDPASLVTTRMTIKNNGRIGIGTDNPVGLLDIRAASKDPGAVPTVHIGDNEEDIGDYGMVNLVRNATLGGTKCHMAFIRNGNTVFGMGYYNNNTNDFAFWKGFGNVTQAPAMIFQATSKNVGIGTTNPRTRFHVDKSIAVRNNANTGHGGVPMTYTFPVDGMYIITFCYIGFYDANITRTYLINKTSFNGAYYSTLAGSSSYIQISTNTSSVTFAAVNLPSNYNDFGIYVHFLGGDGY